MTRPNDDISPDLPMSKVEKAILTSLAPGETDPESDLTLVIGCALVGCFCLATLKLVENSPLTVSAGIIYVAMLIVVVMGGRTYWALIPLLLISYALSIGPLPWYMCAAVGASRLHAFRVYQHFLRLACVEASPEKARAIKAAVQTHSHRGKKEDANHDPIPSVYDGALYDAMRCWLMYPNPQLPAHWKSLNGSRGMRQFKSMVAAALIGAALQAPALLIAEQFVPLGMDSDPMDLHRVVFFTVLVLSAFSLLFLCLSVGFFEGPRIAMTMRSFANTVQPDPGSFMKPSRGSARRNDPATMCMSVAIRRPTSRSRCQFQTS
jgi:hypothetical protein